ncbi:MAG: PAS domain S-box protein [Methanobacteriota archaeon]
MKYRLLVENLNEGVVSFDKDGLITYISPAGMHLFGYSLSDILYHSFTDFVCDQYKPSLLKWFEDLHNGNPVSFDWQLVRKDENIIWVRTSSQLVIDSNGDFGFFGLITDISREKKIETTLRESEEKFRSLVEYSLEGILILDLQGNVIFANKSAADLVEVDCSIILSGRNVMEYIALDSRKDVIHDFMQVSQGHDAYVAEYHAITAKGNSIAVESIGKLITFEGKTAILLSIRDITDRRRAEDAFRESQGKYQELFELSQEAIFLIDNESGGILEANSAATEMYGYTHDQLLHMRNIDLSAELEDTRKATTSTLTSSVIVPIRYHKTKQGDVFPVEISGRFFSWQGRDVHVAAIRDISERQKVEDALRHANRQLTLLTGITRHDILNNIMALFGYLEVVEDSYKDSSINEYLVKLNAVTRVIQSQIEFTRVYENLGAQAPIWQKIDSVLPYSQVPEEFEFLVGISDILIFADLMLERVFFNLLDNAVRHGQKVTSIRVYSSMSGEDLIIVWEDNGIGIGGDDKERIFERGFGKNSGLGLFLVREILSLTGLTIKETGTEGDGAKFEITVPKGSYRSIHLNDSLYSGQ